MKSLFKRSLAAATGSVLALTQLAVMANVNISAVDTAAPVAASESATGVDVTMDAILSVPVDSNDFVNAALDENGAALMGSSTLGTDIGTKLMADGDRQMSVVAQGIRNRAKSVLTRGGYLSAAEVAEIVDKISDADVEITADGVATAEITLGEIGQIVGPAFERFVQKMSGVDFNDPDAPITVDWSKFSIAGKIVIEAKADFQNNSVTYTTTITDETDTKLADTDAIVEYVVGKLNEAADLTLGAARQTKEEKAAQLTDYQAQWDEKQAEWKKADADLTDAEDELKKALADGAPAEEVAEKEQEAADARAKLDDAKAQLDDAKAQLDDAQAQLDAADGQFAKADEQLNNGKEKILNANKLVEAVGAITESDTTLDGIYASYLADLEGVVDKADLSARRKNQILDQLAKWTPETASGAFSNEKVQTYYDKAVNAFNNRFGSIATISVTLDDIQAVIENAEAQSKEEFQPAYEINGYNANVLLYIDDDAQQSELVAAATEAMTPEEFMKAGWTVVLETEDGEKLTEENYDETAEYEIIEVVAKKKITASAETEYMLNGALKFDVERIVTQIVVHKTVVTTTTTTSTTSTTTTTSTTEATTTSTTASDNDGSGTTTSTTASDNEGSGTTTSTTVSDNEGTGTTTSTTAATYVSFDIQGIEQEGLIFWSEETGEFDLSDLSITLRFYESGIATDVKVDVTDAFDLQYHSPADLTMPEGIGVYGVPVYFTLQDVDALTQAIKDAGYGDDLIAQEGIKEGYRAGFITVFLVLRGDADLNGEVDVVDGLYVIQYYVATLVSEMPAQYTLQDPERIYLKNKPDDRAEMYFPFSHYAADVRDGNGLIEPEDGITILRYYVTKVVAENPDTTWDDIVEAPVVPQDDLHANPLGVDPWATYYADKDIDHSVAE